MLRIHLLYRRLRLISDNARLHSLTYKTLRYLVGCLIPQEKRKHYQKSNANIHNIDKKTWKQA